MTLTIDFTPQEEVWLNAQAAQQGLPPAEIVRRLVGERLPAPNGTPTAPENVYPVIDAENQALIDLLRSWREEDATDDPHELERRDAETQELLSSVEANRLTLRIPEV